LNWNQPHNYNSEGTSSLSPKLFKLIYVIEMLFLLMKMKMNLWWWLIFFFLFVVFCAIYTVNLSTERCILIHFQVQFVFLHYIYYGIEKNSCILNLISFHYYYYIIITYCLKNPQNKIVLHCLLKRTSLKNDKLFFCFFIIKRYK